MGKKEYIKANREWLEAKSKEEGVNALDKGVYYKVLSEGKANGIHPTPAKHCYSTLHRMHYRRKDI